MFLKQGVGRPGTAVRGCPGITHQESTLERKVSKFWKTKARKNYVNTCVKTSGEGPGVVQDHFYHCRSLKSSKWKMIGTIQNPVTCQLIAKIAKAFSCLPQFLSMSISMSRSVKNKHLLHPLFIFVFFIFVFPWKTNRTNTSGSLFSKSCSLVWPKSRQVGKSLLCTAQWSQIIFYIIYHIT